ncbi:hypothetical protein HQ865_01135 [Mucilaginibacter mali]|uniref:Uncharacterized protein n=1 Tax=Mucilaginibacter mali TaxID=2740462 RepID=A0A7D4U8S5_9SPHI|nr:hypothetical protein [Mucilaginibacter mali]QKJ28418.1 hypothetical protein HQ865_01135 [Mucilaginibacter mali]
MKLLTWLKKQNEFIPLIAAILLFLYSPTLLHLYDPTAAAYDVGVLQLDILAIIRFCSFMVIVWMTLKVNWLPIRQYFELHFTNDFKHNTTPWQRLKISLSVYFALLFTLALLSRVI